MSLKRNTIWNLLGTGLPLLLGVVAIPYLLRHIGTEAFGILTLIWALIGYFSLFDFGLGRALTQQIASALSSESEDQIPDLAKSGLVFTALTGLAGGVIFGVLSSPLGHSWLKISEALQSQATQSLLIASLGIPLTTVTTGMRGVLEAYEDFKAVNMLRIFLGAANFGLPVLSVMVFGPSLPHIVATLIAARLLVFVGHWILMGARLPAGWARSKIDAAAIRRLLSFGAWMSVSNVISPLMVTADRFVIAAVLGAGAVAYYTVPFEVLIRLLIIPGALTAALFPRLAATLKTNSATALSLYRRSTALVAIVLTVLCAIVAVGSYEGLTLWLGAEFASQSWLIVCVLSLGLLLNGIAFVPFATIQAAGDAKTTALLHLSELIIYVPLLFASLHFFGLLGAAVAWVARVFIDLVLLLLVANRTLHRATFNP